MALKKDCVACYVADEGFLFPSICSAISLRQSVAGRDLDIVILAIDVDDQVLTAVGEAIAGFRIALRSFSPDLDVIDKSRWNGTHVPLAAIGRFFMPPEIIANYHRLLYIDGDTIFRSSPWELLQFDPGAGAIGAAEDIRSFGRGDRVGASGKITRRYFANLGLAPGQGYFNSGLFVARSADWPDMARECLDYLIQNTATCLFHDQSAMNAVLGRANRVRLSLRWNFQTPYNLLGVFNKVDPVVLHFTEANKPWLGPLRPWTEWNALYCEIAALLPNLPRRPPWADHQVAAANRHYAERVRRQNFLFAHRLPGRWRQIRQYEAQCPV